MDESIANRIREAAKNVYATFNCKGVVRIDFIYQDQEQKPYMLEVNTIPGQSEASIIPQQVQVAGMSLTNFYASIVEECMGK